MLVLDEGHHLPEVARDALEMSADITPGWTSLQLDLFVKLVEAIMSQMRPKSPRRWPILNVLKPTAMNCENALPP